jgi:hypothetical protein
VPVPGAIVLLPPLREQCYRILCALRRDGLATQASNEHHIIWSAAPGAADTKIAALQAAYNNYDLVETP